jgi:hypothetical protein
MIARSWFQTIGKRMLGRCAMLAGLAVLGTTSLAAQAQTLLEPSARYPRVRLLPSGELIATVLKNPGDWSVKIFSSTDNGASFNAVGTIQDPDFVKHTSSPDFIVLPNGNLILGVNVDTTKCTTDCYSKIKIYRSTDNGRNWTWLSTPVTASNHEGFWEPNFSIASDGALVITYADETSACCDQKLMKIRSTDGGATWTNRENLVALMTTGTDPRRPGMPQVTKLTDGTGRFLLTYEVCSLPGADQCRSYYKTSTDGWNYGATNTIGTAMAHADGRYWQATTVAKALPGGPLLWMGKHFRTAAGSATGNGTVISKSVSGDPNGPWTTIAAPVTLSNPTTAGCQGFSPGIQWVNAGATIVHLQMRPNAAGSCDVWFGTGPS